MATEEKSKAEANLAFILDCLSKNKNALDIDFQTAAVKVNMTQARNW